MRRLRTNHGGIFAALLALFLQFALTTVSSAALPQADQSLLADLAVICTSNGADDQDGAPSRPGVCDHCTLCQTLRLDPAIVALEPAFLSRSSTAVIFSPPTATLHAAIGIDQPANRGPPSVHI